MTNEQDEEDEFRNQVEYLRNLLFTIQGERKSMQFSLMYDLMRFNYVYGFSLN